jgi:DNA-binding response OmpR family regulator
MAEKKKILIIEDDEMICSMYKTKFEAENYEVYTAQNGADGLEIAKKMKPQMVLLDIILPQIDGFTILEAIKKDSKTKKIPVIMLTNLGTDEDKEKGRKLGAVDYLVKANLTPAQVSQKIKEFFNNKA